jgi:hypothetical protein
MENIVRLALGTKFKPEDIDNILLICQKTDNLEVAVSMLLGLYVEPTFNQYAEDDSYYTNKEFVSYDPFKDKVTFKGNRVTKVYAWFKKDVEAIEENIISNTSYVNDAMSETKFKGTRDEFEDMFTRKEWKRTVNDKAETSTTYSYNWKKEEISYALAE